MSKKSDARYERQVMARIARAEAEMNATILRAFQKLMRVLERERTEAAIRVDRRRRKVK